jgi:hypothetical protein
VQHVLKIVRQERKGGRAREAGELLRVNDDINLRTEGLKKPELSN